MNDQNDALHHAIAAVETAVHGVFFLDSQGVFLFVNDGFCALSGYSRDYLLGMSILTLQSGTRGAAFSGGAREPFETHEPWSGEITGNGADGREFTALLTVSPVQDQTGGIAMRVCNCYDLTERKNLERELRYLTEMDVLTGIPNRRTIREELVREVSRAMRHNHPMSVLMLDIDNFRTVNDRFGSETGDAVLRALSTTVAAVLRPSDRLGRWGGEELVIILPETNRTGARKLADRVLHAVRSSRAIPGYRVTMSIGVSSLLREDMSDPVESLIRRAEEQLHRAKVAGRDRALTPDEE